MSLGNQDMNFNNCPSCASELDIWWRCTACGRDWVKYRRVNTYKEINHEMHVHLNRMSLWDRLVVIFKPSHFWKGFCDD